MTEVVRRAAALPADRGSVVTVGTFDGVHRGHQAVLAEICRRARATGRRSVLLTFDPHPLSVVRPEVAPRLLTTPIEKTEILTQAGIDVLVYQQFDETLAAYRPERFVDEILLGRLRVEELVIGYDHGFGRNRSGDADTLRQIGRQRGFEVDVVPPVDLGDAPVSSSRLRQLVAQGELDQVAEGLGRPYSLTGRVIRGDGRGRTLGFPTANLKVEGAAKLLPPAGVYGVRVQLPDGPRVGALHLGPRPTFEGATPSIEVHILDFDGSLYDLWVRVDFVVNIRGVQRFDGIDALKQALAVDVATARARVPL